MFKLKLTVIVAVTGLLLVGSGVAMAATGHLPDPVKTLLTSSGSNPSQSGQTQAVGNDTVQPQGQDVNQTPGGQAETKEAAEPAEATEPVEATEIAEPSEPAETTEAAEPSEPAEAAEATEAGD